MAFKRSAFVFDNVCLTTNHINNCRETRNWLGEQTQQTTVQGSIGTTVLFGLPLFSRQTIQGDIVLYRKPFKGKSNNCLNLEATVVRIQLVHYDEKMKFVAFQ